jgi:oligopeptide transport system substrate-binding protein
VRSTSKLFLGRIACLAIALATTFAGCATELPGTGVQGIPRQESLVLFGVSPTTLDPAVAAGREFYAVQYIAEIFSGLVRFSPDLELVGDVAESWERSLDGTTYTFYLRRGAEFHDGRMVTAHDFKYSLERACDPATGAQAAEPILGDIVGAKEKLAGEVDEISGIRVVDSHRLRITIDAPKAYFLSKLSHPVAYLVDRYNVQSGANWWLNPNGSGPFKLREWKADEAIVLERNARFYDGPPGLKYVVYRLWGGVPMRMYERGEIDMTEVYLADIERVLDPANPLNEELFVTPGFGLFYIGFNSSRPPFDDARVRQAFCHAVDKDKIVSLVLKSAVSKAEGILPPGMPGYNGYVRGLEFDVEKAQRLIAESEYGDVSNLPPIAFTSYGLGSVSSVEEALVDMWRRNLGVDVEIRLWEGEVYPYIIAEEKDELFVSAWGADYPDPENFLDLLFHSGAEDNTGEYGNPQVDALLERARVEQNAFARMATYQLAQQLVVDDAGCLPLYFDVSYTLVKPYVRDLPHTPVWIPRLRHVSLTSR